MTLGYLSPNRNNEREKVNFFNADGIAAAAGFAVSNVEDLAKFARWQIDLVKSLEKIFYPWRLKLMHEIHWDDELTCNQRIVDWSLQF